MAARITKYLNKYVRRGLCLIYLSIFLFLEPSVSQKNAKNQCALLPGIFVRVLVSHFNSVIATSGPQGGLIHMYDTQNVCQCLCLITIPVDHSKGPVNLVRSKKPWSGRSKLPAVQPLWLNFCPLPVFRIA